MAGPKATVVRTDVLAGPGQMYIGKFGVAALPDDEDVDAPLLEADGWFDVGGTDGGLTVTANQSFFAKRVDQIPDALGHILTERDVQAATSIASGNLRNLAYALNHDPDTFITEGAGFRKFSLKAGQDAMIPDEWSVVVDGWAPPEEGAHRRRVLIRRSTSIESVESAWQKDGLYLIPITLNGDYVDQDTSPVDWIDGTAVAES